MKLSISARWALYFSILLALVVSAVLAAVLVAGLREAADMQRSLVSALQQARAQDDTRALRDSAAYLSNRLFNPLFSMDVSGLNEEITQVRGWLPVRTFEVLDARGRILTDGSAENPRFGRSMDIPAGLAPARPLVRQVEGGTEVWFVVGYGSTRAGHARIVLGDEALQASTRRLQSAVDVVWSRQRTTILVLAVAAAALVLLVAGLLGWRLSRSLARPLREMSVAAGRFAAGQLDHEVPVRGHDEMAVLARSLNSMASSLARTERLLARAQEIAGLGSWEFDRRSAAMQWSRQLYRILDLDPAQCTAELHHLLERLDRDTARRLSDALRDTQHLPFEVEGCVTTPAANRAVLVQGVPEPAGAIVSGIVLDVTERKDTERRLEALASFDSLTGLPNRSLFLDRLGHAMQAARRRGQRVGLLFVDLDRFKSVNDVLGHAAGDELLVEAARRIRAAVRESDTVARLGGDEFTVVLESVGTVRSMGTIADKLLDTLQAPFPLRGRDVVVSASIGITCFPDDGDDEATLLRNADSAMYEAKGEGRSCFRFFTRELDRRAHRRLSLEQSLRGALERGEFELHYQPQVRLDTLEPIGHEALLRWRRAGALVPPDEFIAVLEETGLIVPVGRWVLQQACAQAAAWRAAGRTLRMSVNLSVRQFQHGDLAAEVRAAIDASGLPADMLELEITESTPLESVQSIDVADRLHELGARLAIDDFGTGYSSLSYLKRFHVDVVKVDRSFVRDLASDADDVAIVRAVVSLCGALGIETVAEGVENEAQLAILRDAACQLGQGYLFGRPGPAADRTAQGTLHGLAWTPPP